MSDTNKTADWKLQVRAHFGSVQLSEQKQNEFEKLLLGSDASPSVSGKKELLKPSWIQTVRKSVGYLATAAAAAGLALFFTESISTDNDLLAELASVPAVRSYPPDFDLEGDASALGEIVQEVFPTETFDVSLPEHVKSEYAPREGRFFTWAGGPGVSIRLTSNKPESRLRGNTFLYIVKLSGKNERRFPKDRVVRRSSNNGREKKIHAWREGKYGFAIVQTTATSSD